MARDMRELKEILAAQKTQVTHRNSSVSRGVSCRYCKRPGHVIDGCRKLKAKKRWQNQHMAQSQNQNQIQSENLGMSILMMKGHFGRPGLLYLSTPPQSATIKTLKISLFKLQSNVHVNGKRLHAMLDTGAEVCAIGQSMLDKLPGVSNQRNSNNAGPNGKW